jgi:hypothetical protein
MYRVHSFDWQGQIVWGLTASILIEVAAAALGRRPDFEVEHPSNAGAVAAGEGGGGGAGSSANQSRM